MGVKTLSFKDGIEEWTQDITPDADKVGLINDITIAYTNRDPETGVETTVTTSVNNTQDALEILNSANTAQEGNLSYLNNNMGDMKKSDYGDPIKTSYGGTGNRAGYIRTGHNNRSDIGSNCTIEGLNNAAPGVNSHAEGNLTSAMGLNSHAEGYRTCAIGHNVHTEGMETIAWSVLTTRTPRPRFPLLAVFRRWIVCAFLRTFVTCLLSSSSSLRMNCGPRLWMRSPPLVGTLVPHLVLWS